MSNFIKFRAFNVYISRSSFYLNARLQSIQANEAVFAEEKGIII